jgi:hypothetical protein
MIAAKRIAGRLLRAHRGGAIELGHMEVDACVEGLTRGFVPTHLRRHLGRMWLAQGSHVLAAGIEDPDRRKPVDEPLDALVEVVE